MPTENLQVQIHFASLTLVRETNLPLLTLFTDTRMEAKIKEKDF